MKTLPHDYTGPFNIETYQLGYWESIGLEQELLDALYFASDFCNSISGRPEEYVRVMDYNDRII